MEELKIDERTFQFSLLIIKVYKQLKEKHEFILAKQLLASGTSIGANVEEAQAGQSRKDFKSKMSIASKEARECRYWIRLLDKSDYLIDFKEKEKLIKDVNSIVNIITKIVKSTDDNDSKK